MSMRRSIVGGLVALPLLTSLVVAQPTLAAHHSAHKTYTITMVVGKKSGTYVFNPSKVTIHAGDTVKWVDKSVVSGTMIPHNIVGSDASSKKVIDKTSIDAKSYTVTFKKKGTYKYLCQIHPGMVGQIIVK